MTEQIRNNIRLVIEDIDNDREEKFIKAVGVLADKFKMPSTLALEPEREEMLPVVEEVAVSFIKEYQGILKTIIRSLDSIFIGKMGKSWEFKLPKAIYNPKTGQPLTQKEWNSIMKPIDKYLNTQTKDLAERMALKGAAVGAITGRLEKKGKDVQKVTYKGIKSKLPKEFKFKEVANKYKWTPAIDVPIRFRVDNIADNITSINDRVKSGIKSVLTEGLQQMKEPGDIAADLFEKYNKLNKDWERIARTETQNSVSDGNLVTEIADSERGEKIYMIGAGSANACKHCVRDVIGKIVRLLPAPPEGGGEGIDDPYTNVAIWAGKTSIGHPVKTKWTAITRHPWCACRWVRHYPAM
jgi:hypothetical protein